MAAAAGRAPATEQTGGDIMRRAVVRLIAMGGLLSILGGVAVAQDKKPDATLKLSEGSVAAGIGFSWGKGTLTYQGKTHAVKVQGLSVGEVGITKAEATGEVFNLKKLEDFNGNYTAAGAGGTVGGGAGVTAMRNQNGVVIELRSTTQGANVKLAAQGINLSVTK
jgi:hypothetical protein